MMEHNDGDGILARVVLRNYRSIAACDVRFAPLSILVGPNGDGERIRSASPSNTPCSREAESPR